MPKNRRIRNRSVNGRDIEASPFTGTVAFRLGRRLCQRLCCMAPILDRVVHELDEMEQEYRARFTI